MGTHPRERVRAVTITTPSNTAQAAPQSTNWTVGNGLVDRVDIVIPSGHVRLTGIRLLWGGRQMVPYDGAEFIQGNDDEITVALGVYVHTGILVVQTFNTDDTYVHSHLLRAYVVDVEREAALVLPLPPAPVVGGFEELPPVPEPEALFTPEEELAVSTALDQFLADLDDILTGFLDTLQATLGVTPTSPAAEEPVPVEAGGTVKVPNVVGMQQSPAADKLRAAGFTVTVRQKIDRSKPRFLIVDQAPNGGTTAPAGSDVTITSIRWT